MDEPKPAFLNSPIVARARKIRQEMQAETSSMGKDANDVQGADACTTLNHGPGHLFDDEYVQANLPFTLLSFESWRDWSQWDQWASWPKESRS